MESGIHEENVVERVIPTGNVQIMFHYKNPFVVCQPNNIAIKQPRSIISGLSNSYFDVSTDGVAGVIFVSFHPAGACHFFGFPLSEIENQSLDLSDLFSSEIKQVEELLFSKKTIQEKVSVVENFLRKKFSPIPASDELLLQKSIEFIVHTKGQITATLLADNLCMTTKSLERKFSYYLGKTPKQVIKLMRFQEILRDISSNKNISITEYTYRNGYFDQSHFIKDFKTYAGFTPKDFIAKYQDSNLNADLC
jgi:AraC-like DNA-binding protein